MSHLLWKYYWDNDVEKFRRLLAPSTANSQALSRSPILGAVGGHSGGSPGAFGSSSWYSNKARRASGFAQAASKPKDANITLSKAEVNSRDHAGLTILLRAASSTNATARDFVRALIEHPTIDLYVQDHESGWNALHRALYAGNVSIARMLLERERADLSSHNIGSVSKVGLLIKTKDHEGNSPFDVYNSAIASRSLKKLHDLSDAGTESDSGDSVGDLPHMTSKPSLSSSYPIDGDELFVFGSNKNLSLGVGDEDDRQYPERIQLNRPSHLLHRFYQTYLTEQGLDSSTTLPNLEEIPTLIRNRPLVIRDVVMSKLHSAVLTTDPVSNLYICGVGRGGRLGLGDENTQFKFLPVQGPLTDKDIRHVALGQNHTMAIAGNGELWTWGLNSDSQLGYLLPPPVRADEEPMSLVPRQVFGALKKEIVQGVAASAIHSVAHTGSSLYCWGRNAGQLALMDADSRSLDVQQTPRKVGASLLSAPIEMVSAIDKATTCLLSNHTVWVFTNYGYNLIKFPFPDVFTNHNLTTTSFANRYDPGRKEIRYIASGGDTIAAVTARGDLFTMHLSKGLPSQPAASTTNPVKIKGAVTPPHCIWDSRKDGVISVDVGEHGSVIICTESGAVWKRVKRTKGKDMSSTDNRRKDFKFQRVPYITDCVSVRSSIFGAFAAIRKDNKVMSEEIHVNEKSLWEDLGQLLCLNNFTASNAVAPGNDSSYQSWVKAISRERPGSVPYEILRSADIETDLLSWLRVNSFQFMDIDMDIRTSSAPDIRIPIHSWMLNARSDTSRQALSEFHRRGTLSDTESFNIERDGNKTVLTLANVDILTVLNIVVFMYLDTTIPTWRYTREAPSQAYRFRQVRTEVMKLATKLQMPRLEAAARLQASAEPSLDVDMQQAILDPVYFEDGDIVIELDGVEVHAHSQLICQRCPFFEGMFNGRSQGQWLAGRRNELESADKLRIDLKHVHAETFHYVLSFLYADTGAEMFQDVALATIDDFSELVLDVMAIANELMLDRLSQTCQFIIGKFVTTRNIAHLLNEISPCSVTDFKDTGLEYICLQLESMLENHLLDGLDEDLLEELDEIVRDNQLACFPFARSGRAEALLHDKYPELAMEIDEERQRRVKELAFKASHREEEKKLSSSYKTRFGSLDESMSMTPTPDAIRRKSKTRNEPFSPSLRPKASHGDMIFDMDDGEVSAPSSPMSPITAAMQPRLDLDVEPMPQLPKAWREPKGKELPSPELWKSPTSSPYLQAGQTPPSQGLPLRQQRPTGLATPPSKPGSPWAGATLPTAKLDLKGIMSEASSKSSLTAGLVAQSKDGASNRSQPKMSQKERKKQLQMQAEAQAAAREEDDNRVAWENVSQSGKPAPWKAATSAPRTSLKDMLSSDKGVTSTPPANVKPLVAAEASPRSTPRRTASPDTRFPGQGRTNSSPAVQQASSSTQKNKKPLVPHSKSYIAPATTAEPALGLSMAEIIGQQKREQELVKEAVAKRSLQEIQQEQAFQEWWDQESRRAQEEEARRQARGKDNERGGRRGRKGGGGSSKPKSSSNAEGSGQANGTAKKPESGTPFRGRSHKGRGNKA
ncbi:BTB/POZ domain-containing protein [Paramyrothecium foliicola]|nr:BTB/POZ domain-containing protein [Paramyrothecium foliicola]